MYDYEKAIDITADNIHNINGQSQNIVQLNKGAELIVTFMQTLSSG
jgi:hypothetical protein